MDPESMCSSPQEETGRINYLENLFSEVFAQGRFDNLSKKTRLDFIKDAYNKYSEFEESEQLANENFAEPESELYANEYPSQIHNNQYMNDINKNTDENRQRNLNDEFRCNDKQSISQEEFSKSCRTSKLSQKMSNSTNNSGTQQSIPNFLLNVKPRKRSMKIDDKETQDSVLRFPNLIDNMSARYSVTSTARKDKSDNCGDEQPNRKTKSHSSNLNLLKNKSVNEYDYSRPQQQREQSNSFKESTQVQNEHNFYRKCGKQRVKQEGHASHCSIDAGNQTCDTINYQDGNSSYEYRDNEISYCKQNLVEYSNSNHQYADQYNYNCSSLNGMNAGNVYGNNEGYSTSKEDNYLTIRKCEEVLNQARENFEDCCNDDPEVFHGDQYGDLGAGNQCVYPVGTIGHHDQVCMYSNTQHNIQLEPQTDVTYHENETDVGNSKPNMCSYEYQGDKQQKCLAEESSKSNDYKRMNNENMKSQDVQTDFYSGDEIVQNYTDFENNSNVNTNEFVNQKDENCQEMSGYIENEQEKVKQFIHSLTGFDVLQKHKTGSDPDRCANKYQDNSCKYQNEQTDHDLFGQTVLSASDNKLAQHEHHHCGFQHLQQRPKSRGADNPNIDKHRYYSIPQRQEIEIMQQDSHSAHAVSYYNREKQDCQINCSDFPQEVPNRNTMTVSQELKSSGPNELGNSEYIKSQDYQSQRYINERNSENNNQSYYSQSGTQNLNYNVCDCNNYQFQQDQLENSDCHQNVYLNNAKYYAVDDGSQINNQTHPNCTNKITSGYDDQEMQCHHYSNNNGNQDLMDPRLRYVDNNGCFSGPNNEQGYDNGLQEGGCDSKTSVLKRKYCYMPSLTVGHMEHDVNDRSCYKSYIENLIDHSLQNGKSGSALTSQNVNQGTVMQTQNDVVELETGKAIDLVMNESASQLDSPLCLAITKRLTDKLVQSNTSIPTPCLVALEEPVYLQQLKKLRYDHLRHIEREVKRLESLERFLDTCGCGHMTYEENAG